MKYETARMSCRAALAAAILALLVGCGGSGGGGGSTAEPAAQGATCPERGELCYDAVTSTGALKLVDNRHFLPTAAAGDAAHALEGTIHVSPASVNTTPADADGRTQLPGFSVQWITVDDYLLPLNRDVIQGGDGGRWNVVLSPGRVWSEPGDQGMSRAAFPFTLVTNQWNEAHNGVATFLFDDATITDFHVQVMQETTPWNKIDMWARLPASYEPETIDSAAATAAAFRDELAQRVETRPWSQLSDNADTSQLGQLDRNVPLRDASLAAVLVDDVLYYRESTTRRGDYPFPLDMRHGVFSVTKSSAAALTMLRLAQLYGEEVFDLFVTDYVEIRVVSHSGWNGVTFGHLLSMVAGIGDRDPDPAIGNTFADENDESSATWASTWNTFDRNGKLQRALLYGDYPWGPGEIVRYNTAHTFILGEAMDRFYKAMNGPQADVWQMMLDEVYAPIGIPVMPTIKTLGDDALPIYGFGLFLNAYDTARIMQLLHNDGEWNGEQLLHRDRTRAALYRDGSQGYGTATSTTMAAGARQPVRYRDSFWSFTLSDADCEVRVPYMWGYGGNFVVLLPNGVGGILYADAEVHEPGGIGLALQPMRPICSP
ncbi:MAG: serine hydrolase [Pseudomonadota bacterium]